MSSVPKRFDQIINEKSTALYTAVLKDANNVLIGSGDIVSLSITLCNVADGSIINSRNAQDALNANDVTVDVSGNLVFTLRPADTIIVDPTLEFEKHRATFIMVFNGTSQATWDVDFKVRNLVKVT